jgi:CBS domain containing-hemolysin-like protein
VESDAFSIADIAVRLTVVLFLVSANGFFVASEFALVGARRTRLEAMARRGVTGSRYAVQAVSHLDHYISGTQLGITLASLGLGWIGETTIAGLLIQLFHGLGEPWNLVASHVVAGTIAFALITFLHIVLGELAPKSIALLFPESTSLATAGTLIWFSRVTAPFIAVLNGTASLLLRMIGLRAPTEMERVHRPEEIQLILKQMHEHKQIGRQPVEMIRGVFHLASRTAGEIMTPRTEIVGLEREITVADAAARFLETGFSRLPLYQDSLDHIVGVILAHDVWRAREEGVQDVAHIVRPVPFVPDTKPLDQLLDEMRRDRVHLVVVLDEFGGTRGIVTMEDVVEEVIGEISDEDEPIVRKLEKRTSGTFLVPGDYVLSNLNEELSVDLPLEDAATVAGFIMTKLGRVPTVGDVVQFRGGELEVRVMRGRRVVQAELRRSS